MFECKSVFGFAGGGCYMSMFLFNKLWLVMVISTACVVTSAEPKPTHKSRIVDRVYVISRCC